MKPNLVLIVPPQLGLLEGFSNGVISLANYLRRKIPSLHIELLDLSVASSKEVKAKVRGVVGQNREALLVGITTTTATYQSALRVAKEFRSKARHAVIVLGGHHASSQADVVLKEHSELIDVVVQGEGEIALFKLIDEFPNLESIPGISYLDAMDEIRQNPPAEMLSGSELDLIPPTLEGGCLQSVPGKFDHVTYVSARGCPLRCAFCSVANQKIRTKSITTIVQDIRYLVEKLGYRNVAIEDNFFAHSRKRTIELCDALEELYLELGFSWDCQTRVESMDRDGVLIAMERAGCEAIYLGVESLNDEHLLYLGKTRKPANYLDALQNRVVPDLLESDVACYINLQLGLPGESDGHRNETLNRTRALGTMALEHDREITIFPQLHVVYPGTLHFLDGVSQGRFGDDGHRVFEDFTRWEEKQRPIRTWLGEHFAHGVGGIPEGILSSDQLKKGNFEVNSAKVIDVANYLYNLEQLPGIRVFKYGTYLAKSAQSID